MTIYFVTRHIGALQWATQQHLNFDIHLSHLDSLDHLDAQDTIIGTLPINFVYKLNKKGIRYIHLSLEIPQTLRGVELNAEQLNACQAVFEEFVVLRKPIKLELL
ncbi:MAG: putative CRISPR-associated protein [Acinetobacter sp. 39-4]|nr:MAG: putative CRISPR-associated protein [Acinetobacter sp. 39-4]OJU92034.1 MAG: putative CRISPR-associated protein [Acinetobacter sp. 38-8]